MYEQSGSFAVEINNRPDTLDFAYFSSFDVVVDNWNAWPERNCNWSEKARDGLVRFVEKGGGFVLIHAAGAACYDWPEFREMAMATWGDSTTHGKIEPVRISISDKEHPVTKGIRDFLTTDELWVQTEMMPRHQVICEAYSRKENKGRGRMEPVVFYRRYGKGHLLLQHPGA